MNCTRWLATPLAGTAAVLAGLSLLAIPLRNLTSAPAVTLAPTAVPAAAATHAVLRLRLLVPARRVVLTTTTGRVLLDARDQAAGESEYDALVPLEGGGLDLTLLADFGDAGAATAVFLTVMPDGYDDRTGYAIGSGRLEVPLRYDWHLH